MPHTNPALSRLDTLRRAHQAGWAAGERSRRRRGARGWSLVDWVVAHRAFEVAMVGEPADEHERRHGLGDAGPLYPSGHHCPGPACPGPGNAGLVDQIGEMITLEPGEKRGAE